MFKLGLTLGGLAICNAILASILTPWYIVTHFGVGTQTDSFFASAALPQLVFLVTSFSLTQVLVPILSMEDEQTFHRDAWAFFLGITALFSLFGLVLFFSAGFWVPAIVPGFSANALQLAIKLSRIQLLSMIGNACVVVLWSVLYARQKFLWAEISSFIANSISLAFLLWGVHRFGIAGAAWAAVLNLGLKTILLIPGLGPFERPQWDSYAIREAWRRMKPFLLGQTYAKSDPLIDRFLTSLTTAGHLSLLYIGQQAYSSANLIAIKAISTPSIPQMAMAAKLGDWPKFKRIYRDRLIWMLAITTAAALGVSIMGEPLLRLMIGHGGITTQNVHTLWWIMLGLLGFLIGGAAGQVISGAFYALGDTRTPTMLFIGTYTIYIPIKILIFLRYGVVGLAVVTSVHLTINFIAQFLMLEIRMARLKARSD